jgi:mannosyltransferase
MLKTSSNSRFPNSLLLIGVLIFALILRLPLLNGSFWLDEAAQAIESSRPLTSQLDIAYDFQPPLMHLLVHFALFFSRSEWWLRLVGALIPGLVTIWATVLIGKKIASPSIGLIAGLLLTTNSFHIFYSQELRPYSLPAMFALLSWLVLLNWPESKLKVRITNKKELIFSKYSQYALLTLLGLYSSYLYPFLILSQIAYIALLKRKFIKKYIFFSIIWIGGFLPWLPKFIEQFQVGAAVRTSLPGWENVVSITQFKSLALVFGKFIFGVLDLEVSGQFIGFTLVVLLGIGYGFSNFITQISFKEKLQQLFLSSKKITTKKTKFKQDHIAAVLVFLLWVVVPLLTAWIISWKVPVIRPKRVLFLLPGFYLLVSTIIMSIERSRLKFLLLGLLLTLNIFSVSQYYLNQSLQREDWRNLHQLATSRYPNSSIAVFSFTSPFAPWSWYDQDQYPTLSTGSLSTSQVDLKEKLKPITSYQYLLVFDYLRDLTDPDDALLQEIHEFGYSQVDQIDQENIGFVRVFAQPSALVSSTN